MRCAGKTLRLDSCNVLHARRGHLVTSPYFVLGSLSMLHGVASLTIRLIMRCVMANWQVKQGTEYLDFVDDSYAVPGRITFFSPADEKRGHYWDRTLTPEQVVKILDRLDKAMEAMERIKDDD